MKNIILSLMAAVMMTNTAMAMSPAYDDFGDKTYYSDTVEITDDTVVIDAQTISDWDYFWGTTLNPANTGWNDFWFQCQDPDKDVGACVGTVFVGLGSTLAAPVAIFGLVALGGAITAVGLATAAPAATTVLGPVTLVTSPFLASLM